MSVVQSKPYSVSEYIEILNNQLSELYGEVIGEVSEFKLAASGHAYFTIKDKDTGHILPCTLWRRDFELCGVELEIGMEVLVKGKPNFYGPFGKLSFIGKTVELVGEGALKKAYEVLKKKLEKEGLFAAARKRPIPDFPQKIGVITSVRGAVIHDFSNNLRKSGFKVKILDTRVEGPESGRDLTLAMRAMRKEDIDVLVLIRGGGSMQSLAGYDNEVLIREIARFPVPVIAGVGHHEDVPLAALAADAAESTPSLCAALLNRPWIDAVYSVEQAERTIFDEYASFVANSAESIKNNWREIENSYMVRMERIAENLNEVFVIARSVFDGILKEYHEAKQKIERAMVRIDFAISAVKLKYFNQIPKMICAAQAQALQFFSGRVDMIARVIENSSPERQLRLGYSIVSSGGKLLRSVKDVRLGQEMIVQVADGKLAAVISKIQKHGGS